MAFDSEEMLAAETVEIEAARPATELLIEIQDDDTVRRLRLGRDPIVIGAARTADVTVRDPTVSGRHCALRADAGAVVIEDLGSRNGTYVGGARVHRARAEEGATILVGQTTIACLAADEDEDEGDASAAPLAGIAGHSSSMRRIAAQVRRLAKLRAPVLVSGETGTGKELIARALHVEGARRSGPFVALNVSALPRELVESELFGHERGAFTGAVNRRAGAFHEAEGGTLFLDEIGELPLEAQPKLLRALDGYEVRRVGASGSGQRADARIVAATHVPLLDCVREGTFRRDLYHRLEVFVVELPPLRERRGDVSAIARSLLAKMVSEVGPRELTPAAIAQLTAHDWPGNVRELRNALLRASDQSRDERWIDSGAVARALRRSLPPGAAMSLTPQAARDWLSCHGGNVSAAARAARIPRTTFRKLLAKTGPPKASSRAS